MLKNNYQLCESVCATTFYLKKYENLETAIKFVCTGSTVKIKLSDKTSIHPSESFWINVIEVNGPHISGTIDDDLKLTHLHGVKYNDIIKFDSKYICDVFVQI